MFYLKKMNLRKKAKIVIFVLHYSASYRNENNFNIDINIEILLKCYIEIISISSTTTLLMFII